MQGGAAGHCQRASSSFFHPACTCRMGSRGRESYASPANDSVVPWAHPQAPVMPTQHALRAMRSGFQVDAALRVHDVAALRIADASVAPAIPSAPTQVLRRNILDYTHYRCRPVGYCGVRGAGYVLYDWASCSRDCARLHGTMTQRLCSPARRHYAKLQPVCGNCGKT